MSVYFPFLVSSVTRQEAGQDPHASHQHPSYTPFCATDKPLFIGLIRGDEVPRELGLGCLVKVETALVDASCTRLRRFVANSQRPHRKAAYMHG